MNMGMTLWLILPKSLHKDSYEDMKGGPGRVVFFVSAPQNHFLVHRPYKIVYKAEELKFYARMSMIKATITSLIFLTSAPFPALRGLLPSAPLLLSLLSLLGRLSRP